MPKIESIKERQADFAIRVGLTAASMNPDRWQPLWEHDLRRFYNHWTKIQYDIMSEKMLFETEPNFNLEKELEKWLS